MATNISPYLGNKLTRWLGGQAMPTAPVSVFAALFLAGTEVTTTIRVAGRVAIAWTVPASGSVTAMVNSADVDFGNAASGSNVDEIRLFDAASSGNLLYSKPITTAVVVAGEQVKMSAGNLSIDNS